MEHYPETTTGIYAPVFGKPYKTEEDGKKLPVSKDVTHFSPAFLNSNICSANRNFNRAADLPVRVNAIRLKSYYFVTTLRTKLFTSIALLLSTRNFRSRYFANITHYPQPTPSQIHQVVVVALCIESGNTNRRTYTNVSI